MHIYGEKNTCVNEMEFVRKKSMANCTEAQEKLRT